MDLLAKRYASPCFVLSGYIGTGRLCEFIREFSKIEQEEREEKAMWDYFMHRMPFYEGSFNDFVEETKCNREHQTISDEAFKTTLNHTNEILRNFNPEQGV